jgi:ATP-dependent DNA helicase RecG
MEMAEEQGLGIKSLRDGAEKLGLPIPKYTFEDPYLVLTLYRSPESATHVLKPDILDSLNRDERAGWEFLASRSEVTMAEYAGQMKSNKRKAQRHLKHFVELRLLRPVGSGRTTTYKVLRP